MANVQPEHGTAPVAYAILDALSRDGKMRMPAQIMLWVMRNTWGRRTHGPGGQRRKTCSFTWTKIADHIGADHSRSRVSRVGRELIESGRLYVDARGHIGIQKDYEKWVEGPGAEVPRQGGRSAPGQISTPGGAEVPRQGGQIGTSIRERAREVLTAQSKPISLSGANQTLPNGKNDTPTARADAGLADFPPMDHPEYSRLSFKVQDRLAERWESSIAEERKKVACRKCQIVPRAENWAWCRGCTSCGECGAKPGNGRIFVAVKNEIICKECREKKL